MSELTAADDEREVAIWFAFERLGHAYLVRDDEGVQRELAFIAALRDDAAASRSGAELRAPTEVPRTLRDRVADVLTGAVERVLVLPVVPVMVMGGGPTGRTEQGKANLDESSLEALGRVGVRSVVDGSELAVTIRGLAAGIEGRLRLYADEQGRLHQVDLVPTTPGAGVVSATLPWTAGLPQELVVVVLAPDVPIDTPNPKSPGFDGPRVDP